VQRQLEDFRLLSPTDQKEVARLHRLIGAHLVKRLEEGERKLQLVREQLLAVAEGLADSWRHNTEQLWQLAPLQAATTSWAPDARGGEYSCVADVVGVIEMTIGRLDAAEPFLRGAMEVDEANYRADLQSDTAKSNLAISLTKLADLWSQRGLRGDAERALAYSERSLQLREEVLKADPQSGVAVRAASYGLVQLADFLKERAQPGDSERALKYYERSLSLREQLRKTGTDSAQVARDHAVGLEELATFLRQTQPGATDRALEYLERGLRLFEELLEKNPQSAEATRDVSVALERLADLLTDRGQPGDDERALGYLERDLTICEELLTKNPHSAQAREDVAGALMKMADLLTNRGESGDAERALGYYKRVLQICEQLHHALRESVRAAQTKLVALDRIADATARQPAAGGAKAALSLQQQALDLALQLWDSNPTSAFYGHTAVVSLWRTAVLAQAAGGSDLAAQCWSDCHALLKHLISAGFELDRQMHDMYATLNQELNAPD
ncbi:MAG TPA: hypothetical protein VNT75_04790, partial [Symbiobacteriaceae bacterium]|nr:hypothetical protein [Symbiobacteriaceae bacterium]